MRSNMALPRRFAGDVERFENRHAAGDQRAQGPRGAGQDVLFDQLAEDRHLEDEHDPSRRGRALNLRMSLMNSQMLIGMPGIRYQ